MNNKPVTKEKALARLAALCSRSEQCEDDLIKKLISWKLDKTTRNEIIEYLKDNKFLDNERYTRSYVNDKAKFSFWGPSKIRAELIRKRIPSSLINSALETIDSEIWKTGLIKNAISKSKNIDLLGEEAYKERQKLMRYLIGRGFSATSASKAVSIMKKRQEENE